MDKVFNEPANQPQFKGKERFQIRRCLGSGGFGVVYEAYDRERNAIVALKTIHKADAQALYRFKQEFRRLADISHPNLVTLYELLLDGEQCFFTMELVQGIDFLQYLRPVTKNEDETATLESGHPARNTDDIEGADTVITPSKALSTSSGELETIKFADLEATGGKLPPAKGLSLPHLKVDPERIRETLRQLAAGIQALHEAGKLHRDIKPSNVLVTGEGRVVILDFGIATELTSQEHDDDNDVVGTPAYMSPEQCAGLMVCEATDWYSVGVMLYQTLTGKLPFRGQIFDILIEKQRSEPPPPSRLVKDIPPDLDQLCQQLLKREPKQRPTGVEVLQCLNASGINYSESKLSAPQRAVPFVGREDYLATLMAAFNTVKYEGRTATVYIQGRSGMGKSALVHHFLKQLKHRESNIVVLSGRCYEQESVPYKALDSLIDALSQYLKQLPALDVGMLLSDDLLPLVRLFPVLKQVASLDNEEQQGQESPDSQEMRRRAFTALRELLARLAAHAPLILYIDDLQWGDLDSAALLSELLRPPDPPRFLLITTYRSEDVATSPLLSTFLPMRAKADAQIDVREIVVKELSQEESHQLAVALMGKDEELLSRADKIAQEARGNPFFVDELVRFMQLSEAPVAQGLDTGAQYRQAADDNNSGDRDRLLSADDSGLTRLDQVIKARVMRLPEEARRLLEAVAVAGQPLERSIARQASQLDAQEQGSYAVLRANRMIRVTGISPREAIETYHDRIRETVVACLAPETLKAHHGQLGALLEATGAADPERLANHFHKAGNYERAAKYTIEAAEKAFKALAFDRAARLYQQALELRAPEDELAHNLRVKWAESLNNAGRNYEAAKIYLIAAETARDREALALRQRAADMFLRSGYLEQGMAELRIITDQVGIKIAKTPVRALLSFLLQRLKIRLRGLEFNERPASEVASEDLLRLDTFWSVSTGLSMIDATRGVELQARHLLFALKVGEPQRVARALAAEAGYTASAGGRKAARTEYLLQLTNTLAERIQYPYAMAISAHVAGIAASCFGQWKRSIAEFARAATIFRQHCTGVSSELDQGTYWTFTALYFIGDFNQLFNRLPAALKDINERGNLFGEVNLRLRTTYIRYLAGDEVESAKAELTETIGRWSQRGFHMQHFWHLFGQVQTRLYAGEADTAWQLINEKWPIVTKSLLLRIQSFYLQAFHLRARCVAALVAKDANALPLLNSAERDLKLIEKENMPWGNAFAQQIRASIAAARGDREQAITHAANAEAGFEAVDMALYAAMLRRRRGELMGGSEGEALIESADVWMRGQQIKNPRAMADMLAPGRWQS